jgi:hypothetical protein
MIGLWDPQGDPPSQNPESPTPARKRAEVFASPSDLDHDLRVLRDDFFWTTCALLPTEEPP